MKIIVINKDRLEKIPPLISVINILSDLGHDVHVITGGLTENQQRRFEERGIAYETHNYASASGRLKKIYQYISFRKTVKQRLSELSFDLLWIEGGNTIRSLGKSILPYPYILQISEMYENHKPILKAIDSVIHNAKAVMIPEYNRAVIYQTWFKLTKRPIVLPNKPEALPSSEECQATLERYNDILNPIKNKKIILYQGGISRTRMLDRIAMAMKELGDEYHLLLIGPEQDKGVLQDIQQANSNVSHIDFIPAPNYLAFCKIAHVGVVCYAPESLNNIFCAPNKICEYSEFSLPMLGNDIPGLKFTIAQSGAGVVVNPNSVDSIVDGFRKIDSEYQTFRERARLFNESVDNERTIDNCLKDIYCETKQ